LVEGAYAPGSRIESRFPNRTIKILITKVPYKWP
jgi:hypothetical protein